MLTPQQAWSSICAHIRPLPAEELDLAGAAGHVLARDVWADRDLPPAPRSAMDGFALRAADLPGAALRVVGEVAAGSPERPLVAPGTCVRIFTGANVPPGADTVVRLEDSTEREADLVRVEVKIPPGANILRQGENARAGQVILPIGVLLSPMASAICASVGVSRVAVVGKPRVAVLTTGRELLAPESAALAHQERDANQTMIRAALVDAEFQTPTCERVSDDCETIVAKLRTALKNSHVVVLSGGVSAGAYDFVPTAAEVVGARTVFHGVAMRPGKPFLFAMAPGGAAIFGLPGNPLSAATGLHEFVLPALRRMAGLDERACRPLLRARLRESLANKPGRPRYVLASMTWAQDGLEVSPLPSQSSADLVAGGRADGVIVVPADVGRLEGGALVDFRPWRRWP